MTSNQAWPAMGMDEVRAALTAPGARFEMETVDIRGIPTRIWKNAPPHMAALVRLSRTHGAALATIHDDERVTFEAQFRAIATLAAHYRALGVEKGDRVAVAARNLPEWVVAFFAATTIGAIAVPLNAWWTAEELCYGLADSGAVLLVADDERWQRVAPHRGDLPALRHVIVARAATPLEGAARIADVIGTPHDWAALPDRDLPEADLSPEDEATTLYTSGTTGKPKGALATHRNFMTNILSSGYAAARSILRLSLIHI